MFELFERIVPYLSNPLILIGFLAMLFIGIFYSLMKTGLIKLSAKDTSNLLKYSFIIALVAIVAGTTYSVLTKVENKLPDVPKNNANAGASSGDAAADLQQKIKSFQLIGEGEKVKLTFVSEKKGISMNFDAPVIFSAKAIKNKLISHFEFNKDIYQVVGENIVWTMSLNDVKIEGENENKMLKDLGAKNGDIVKLHFESKGNTARKKQ